MVTTDYSSEDTVEKYSVYPLLHKLVGKPKFLDFVGDVENKRVLDLGCGTGHIAHELALRGAHVVAVDLSSRFIEQAQASYSNVDFRILSGANLNGLESASFDKVIMVMVLVNVANIKDFAAIFRECARVLKKGGELLMSTAHPLTVRPFKDALRQVEVTEQTHYFDHEMTVRMRFLLSDMQMIEFTDSHWTLEDISMELERNHFVISQLREPRPENNDQSSEYWQYLKDALVTPHYLFIKAIHRS